MSKLALSMMVAWHRRAEEARYIVRVFLVAPALVKPDAVAQAQLDYAHAQREYERWSS